VISDKDTLKNASSNALKMMKDSGFEISDRLEVVLDPNLTFMGYSTERGNGHVIVVSGAALKSGLVEGLLIHEMSHVYSTNTNHPSHNHDLLNRVVHVIIHKNRITEDYQLGIVHQAINHIQDLYADDIAFRVFKQTMSFPTDQLFNFFLSRIKDKPIRSKNVKARWLNAGMMLNNCFAVSNMMRHNIKDTDNRAESTIERFLSQTDNSIKNGFTHFENFMVNLKENTTEKEFALARASAWKT